MRLNSIPFSSLTHEGAPAAHLTPIQALRRSVLCCLLWEKEFYEDGQSIADRIVKLSAEVPASALASLAIKARTIFNLRHVPLVLLSILSQRERGSSLVPDTFPQVIRRADELAEFLAVDMALRGLSRPKLTHGVRKGLAKAFLRFDAYQLAKYNRDGAIKLRDVLRLVHPKAKDSTQNETFALLNSGDLPPPDTWEVALSSGANKAATFTRLLQEGNLGYLALLRNLRNMVSSGVDLDLIRGAILARRGGAEKVLPFRFVAAARACPQLEPALDASLLSSLATLQPFPGHTIILVDVSGSMNTPLSARSDLTRMDAACTLAAIIPGQVRVFSFSDELREVPPRKGMAGVDAIRASQPHQGTYLGKAIHTIQSHIGYDRLIVLTDEQSHDPVPPPTGRGYMVNLASSQNAVGYGPWHRISGFSESILRYIQAMEEAPDA